MIIISTATINPYAPLRFQELPESDIDRLTVRASRTPTLDGGAVIDHRGLCQADQTIRVKARLSREQNSQLEALLETETVFTLACERGVFSGIITSRTGIGGNVDITFEVLERL